MTSLSPTIYTRAFRKALKEKHVKIEELIQNLARIVNKGNTPQQGAKIARRVSEEIVHHAGGRWVVICTARPLADFLFKKIKKMFLSADYIEQRVEPELVSGMRIVIDGEKEFDSSLKRKLDTIF